MNAWNVIGPILGLQAQSSWQLARLINTQREQTLGPILPPTLGLLTATTYQLLSRSTESAQQEKHTR
jgi:hypothetical protein